MNLINSLPTEPSKNDLSPAVLYSCSLDLVIRRTQESLDKLQVRLRKAEPPIRFHRPGFGKTTFSESDLRWLFSHIMSMQAQCEFDKKRLLDSIDCIGLRNRIRCVFLIQPTQWPKGVFQKLRKACLGEDVSKAEQVIVDHQLDVNQCPLFEVQLVSNSKRSDSKCHWDLLASLCFGQKLKTLPLLFRAGLRVSWYPVIEAICLSTFSDDTRLALLRTLIDQNPLNLQDAFEKFRLCISDYKQTENFITDVTDLLLDHGSKLPEDIMVQTFRSFWIQETPDFRKYQIELYVYNGARVDSNVLKEIAREIQGGNESSFVDHLKIVNTSLKRRECALKEYQFLIAKSLRETNLLVSRVQDINVLEVMAQYAAVTLEEMHEYPSARKAIAAFCRLQQMRS